MSEPKFTIGDLGILLPLIFVAVMLFVAGFAIGGNSAVRVKYTELVENMAFQYEDISYAIIIYDTLDMPAQELKPKP